MNSMSERMQVTVSADRVPDFLLQAHTDARAGATVRAQQALTEANLQTVETLPEGSEPFLSSQLVLGQTWQILGRLQEAARCYEQVRRFRPEVGVLLELAKLYRSVARFSQALACYREVLAMHPDWPEVTMSCALCLTQTGQMQEGLALLKSLIDAGKANAEIHLNYLFHLHYLPETDRQTLLEGHQQWAERYAPATLACTHHANAPDPQRVLRIGYLSADFHTHSVAYTFEPMLDGHNAQAFTLYGYGHVAQPDATTERLVHKFDHYRDVYGCTPKEIAQRIQEDQIDILVSLAGHSNVLYMQTLAYKPAPLQVDIGSVSTTGLPQLDYKVTDSIMDPVGVEASNTEQLLYVPDGCICYRPPRDVPPVKPLPALTNGYITFGTFANHLKIHASLLGWWASILHHVADARLLIKCTGGNDISVTQWIKETLQGYGIDPARVQIVGWVSKQEHFELYNQVDIALDTYPFNGNLTILEALLMGVPTVSLTGKTYAARCSRSVLTRNGLASLVADTPERMIATAIGLAGNLDVLTKLRQNLRLTLLNGPLCDARGYTGALETHYRNIWQRWCEERLSCEGGYE